MRNKEIPTLIKGGISVDDRGYVIFNNEFEFKNIKRFYILHNFSKDTIRAFHGHLKESKYVMAVYGSAIIAAAKLSDIKSPDKNEKVYRFVISDKDPAICRIPAGYANGFKVLEDTSKILFFSTNTLDESLDDDYRYPFDYWGKEVWEVENR